MSTKVSNSSKRLQEMMDVMNLKQTDIVATTGITKSALSNYLHGTREPRQDQISRIADPYKINPTWLMGYDVPMFMDDTQTKEIDTSAIPTPYQMLLLYLAQLNDEGFQEAIKRIEELTELDKYKKEKT